MAKTGCLDKIKRFQNRLALIRMLAVLGISAGGIGCLLAQAAVPDSRSNAIPQAEELKQGYRPLVAALHIHSRFSNGNLEISELAAYGHQHQIDVLGITDSLLTRVRYGVGPWKKLISYWASRRAVIDHGVQNYLTSLQRAQRQFEDVVLIPGLEVAPYYYWQGDLFDGLRLFDFDRHILIFGLYDPEVIRNLPVIENETWANTQRDWGSTIGPGAMIICGAILLFVKRVREVRLTYFSLRKQRRFWLLGLVLLLVGGAWAYNDYPFGRLSDPYSGKGDIHASQHLIDFVRRRAGLTFLSYPEARVADIKMGGSTMVSAPHPEDLWLMDQYTGFEGVYGGDFRVTEPGNVWDRVLIDYLQGGRRSWPSVITGIDFHDFRPKGGWYDLIRGQTVLWAKRKDQASVLDALRRGRGYAIFQPVEGEEVTLRDFTLKSDDRTAVAGETMQIAASVTVSAVVDWRSQVRDFAQSSGTRDSESANHAAASASLPKLQRPAHLELIRNGERIDLIDSQLPMRLNRTETLGPGKYYYRLRVVFGLYQELLSNPIFVEMR
ncbi:MAG TPA: hypothetical protein VGL91_19565 [Acidobacteriota bacterium]|jgi:hypothetical protein